MSKPRYLLLALVVAVLAAAPPKNPDAALGAARHLEEAEGNYPAAINAYKKFLAEYGNKDRVRAAKALVRLAQCYEKLGNAEAKRVYERIVKEFGDQKEAAAEARQRLSNGGSGGQLATQLIWSGNDVDPGLSSVSPDGRWISFPEWDTANLGLRDLATATTRLLTNTGTWKRGEMQYAEGSAISRDGKQVAYAWFDQKTGDYELRVLNLNGDANPRRVFAGGGVHYLAPKAWTLDGKSIVTYLSNNNRQMEQIGLIGVQDGSVRVLKSGKGLSIGGVSPDGRYVAYVVRRNVGAFTGFILSTDGQSDVPLIAGNASTQWPIWTPDGSRLIFVSDRGGSMALWSVRIVDGKPSGEPELLPGNTGDVMLIGFSRDGTLFYGSGVSRTDIYLAGLDPKTGKLTAEPRRVNEQSVGAAWGRIAWLPDGKSLSFWNRTPVSALVVHTLETREQREIWGGRSGRQATGYAGWFPDGKTILGHRSIRDGEAMEFRTVNAANGATEATWTLPGPDRFAVSPDMTVVYSLQKDEAAACTGLDCQFAAVAHDLTKGNHRELFRFKAALWRNMCVSPDGRQLAILTRGGILVAPTSGGPPRQVYASKEIEDFLAGIAWAADNNHIIALRSSKQGGTIWSYSTTGGEPQQSPIRVKPSEQPAVSPDGTQIAFVGREYRGEMWKMTGLLPQTVMQASRKR